MWRPFTSRCLASSVCRVPAALEATCPVATQRRWGSNIKITKQLKKMMDRRGGPKKKKLFPGPVHLRTNGAEDRDLNPRMKKVYTEGQRRRAHQVGRVLYNNIVHLINSGEVSSQLAALSVEIVQVKVVPDFSSVNVYWLASGSEEDKKVETLLRDGAGLLRQLLTSQHVLPGAIPRITFVRDDSQARYMEVEALLRKADFGPDFVPTQLGSSLRENIITLRTEGPLSSVDKLQSNFNRFSLQISDESFPAEPGFEVGRESECDGKTSPVEGSSLPQRLGDGATVSELYEGQSILQPMSPSSLDVQKLGKQFLSAKSAKDITSTFTAKTKIASVMERFRDNLYGVPRSELINKIMLRKQKTGTRLKLSDAQESEAFMQRLQSSGSKLPFQKKSSMKAKGRLKMQSDFYGAGLVEVNTRDDYYLEEDGVSDEERDDTEDIPSTSDEPHRK